MTEETSESIIEPELETAPVVFLSYSHDNREHKQWVASFASELVEKGVEVLFDQWDIGLGDDIPKFMERAVAKADRVLMVCTEPYVRKADDGIGGAGYEAMIVTGELVRDLGTNKFIPVVRQSGDEKVMPRCFSTRFYIDLSEGADHAEQIEHLLRELHNAPTSKKPKLGANPFAGESFANPTKIAKQALNIAQFDHALSDPEQTYQRAIEIIRTDDRLAWRKLTNAAENHAVKSLIAWRGDETDYPEHSEKDPSALFEHAERGLAAYAPWIACLIAAAESGKKGYADQLSWIDKILKPEGWEQSGLSYWLDFPTAALFVTQALVGGMLMEVDQGKSALSIGVSKITDRFSSQQARPIFANSQITGWPDSLDHHCSVAWGFLDHLIDNWEWLGTAFGGKNKCRASISGYYLLLNFLNFIKVAKASDSSQQEIDSLSVTVPLMFCKWGSSVCQEGYKKLLQNTELLHEVLESNNLIERTKVEAHWSSWKQINGKWMSGVFGHFHFDLSYPQAELMTDLYESDQSPFTI